MADGVAGALEAKRKLTLKDVQVDFKKYNFIISLNGLTIDTSVYAQAVHNKGQIVGAYDPADKKGWLALTTNTGNIAEQINFIPNEKRIIIFEETVDDIKVKSVRNFLHNQITKE